jgi:hypothetical protein
VTALLQVVLKFLVVKKVMLAVLDLQAAEGIQARKVLDILDQLAQSLAIQDHWAMRDQ